MSLSANKLFYTNTDYNDASNALINYNNLTGNSESLEHPLSKYARGLFFSPNYNKEFFDAINWANNLGQYNNQNNLNNPLDNNVMIIPYQPPPPPPPIYTPDGNIPVPHLWNGFWLNKDWSMYFKVTSSLNDHFKTSMKTPADGNWPDNLPFGTIGFNHPDITSGGGLYFGWIPGVGPLTMMKGHFRFTTTDSIEYEVLISYNSTRFITGVNSAPDWEDIDVFYKKDSSGWIKQAELGHVYSQEYVTPDSNYETPLDQEIFFDTTTSGISDIKLWNNRVLPGDGSV